MSTFNVEGLRDSKGQGPVTMINLIKYRDVSLDGNSTGREAYARYAKPVQALVENRGGKVLWAGPVGEAALHEGVDADCGDDNDYDADGDGYDSEDGTTWRRL